MSYDLAFNSLSKKLIRELIYKDDDGAVVRSWLWREADRTKLTKETRNALIYMELVNKNGQRNFSRL